MGCASNFHLVPLIPVSDDKINGNGVCEMEIVEKEETVCVFKHEKIVKGCARLFVF